MTRFTPTKIEEKELLAEVSVFMSLLERKLPEAKIILGGSVAKGTWLSQTDDVDIFLAFEDDLDISNKVEKAIKDLKPERVHGSRDYFCVTYGKHVYELIPILHIKKPEEAKNITDISPLHAAWVNKHTNVECKEEIRKAKQFFKAHRLYGAESYVHGFSGYVLEILIIYYGSFEELLKATKKWKPQHVIDPQKHHKRVFFEVNHSKLQSGIIVIDPVQPGRNAAAAVSDNQVAKLKKIAKDYLKKPSDDFFTYVPFDLPKLKTKGYVIEVIPLKGKQDVVGAKLEKVFLYIKRYLEPFTLEQADWEWLGEKAHFYYQVKEKTLPQEEIIKGPPLDFKDHVLAFKAKYKHTSQKEGVLLATTQRVHTAPQAAIIAALKEVYVIEKTEEAILL